MNNWIEHCKKYAKEHNVSYRQALKDAKASYKKSEKKEVEKMDKPVKKKKLKEKNVK